MGRAAAVQDDASQRVAWRARTVRGTQLNGASRRDIFRRLRRHPIAVNQRIHHASITSVPRRLTLLTHGETHRTSNNAWSVEVDSGRSTVSMPARRTEHSADDALQWRTALTTGRRTRSQSSTSELHAAQHISGGRRLATLHTTERRTRLRVEKAGVWWSWLVLVVLAGPGGHGAYRHGAYRHGGEDSAMMCDVQCVQSRVAVLTMMPG
jgi:hypothetical protein